MNKIFTFYKADKKKSLKLPLYLTPVIAGFPSPADDYIEKKLDLNEYLITNPPATFLVKVEGDSMKDAGICKEDILIIDRSITPTNNKIVIAVLNGEFTLKRIKMIGSEIFLQPENDKYQTIKISKDMDFEIFGTVTYIIHKAK
ncbi:MAG: translesion error-prone DNA polymerase V autoproteolytic subunit [Parachlamydiales bacterium]|nr:translesion error-prone DNA polymerase V autoproteolytic subunit [Parachlamydiales bacterium]